MSNIIYFIAKDGRGGLDVRTFLSKEVFHDALTTIVTTEREALTKEFVAEWRRRHDMESIFNSWLLNTEDADGDNYRIGCSELEDGGDELIERVRSLAAQLDKESGGAPHSFAQIHSAVAELILATIGPQAALNIMTTASGWGGLPEVNPAIVREVKES